MNKKAQTNMPRSINIILGLIMIAIGGLAFFGANIGINLPLIPEIVLIISITVAGFIIMLDGFMGVGSMGVQIMPKTINRLLGVLVFLIGIALLLPLFGIIAAIPIPAMVLKGVILAVGVLMLFDGILGQQNF